MKRTVSLAVILALSAGLALASDPPKASPTKGDPAIEQIDQQITNAKVDKNNVKWRTALTKPEKVAFTAGKKYFALMETNKGPIKIRLMPDVAPMHVTSFIYLSRLGFFDGLKFHRVIPGFMAQGGCPLGTGSGSPGYEYGGEFSPTVKHDKPGLLSMANRGPNTDGSQFFLTFVPTPHLDGKHTIYGEIVEGMDTMKKLEALGSPNGATKAPLSIEKVTIQVG